MDPFKTLKSDHRTVEELFKKIDDAKGDARLPLIEELTTALQAHMQLEEKLVYPLVAKHLETEMAEEGNTEHQLAREGIDKMLSLAPDAPGFGAALEMVKSGIEHHVEEEESEMFPKLTKALGAGTLAVAQQIVDMRAQLGMPDADLASTATKDELLEAAKQAGIEARADMTKDELAAALVGQRAS
jgi:iron-sulfur cluster repair protein YtfE (RIC family)